MEETSRVRPPLSRGPSGPDPFDGAGAGGAGADGRALPPLLHDLVSCVRAPSLTLSDPDGQLRPGGVQGWFRDDRRLLSTLTVALGGHQPAGLRGDVADARSATFTSVSRHLGDPGADPTVLLDRTRTLDDERLVETFTVTSTSQSPVDVEVELTVASDLAPMDAVRSGQSTAPVAPSSRSGDLVWSTGDGEGEGDDEAVSVAVRCDPAPDDAYAGTGRLTWHTRLAAGERFVVRLTAETSGPTPTFAAPHRRPWSIPQVSCADARVDWLVRRSLADLEGLLLSDPRAPDGDHFLAAGTPWFLTLFGRDSLLAARMVLPLGTELALSTLRTLARRQGERDDTETEEQPGKILHEVRPGVSVLGSLRLPPVYFGTIDATPLFVVLLAEAWRWGAPADQVAELLPAAERCLSWIERELGEGFLKYVDSTGHGLSNQGWKDSDDGIQWADGRLAEPPIALSEVQGYAHQAALAGADLLEAFGRGGAEHWRDLARRLNERFRTSFWVSDDAGPYPAVAVDRDGRPVDSVASNMGRLLGTGILDADEAALVATRLASPELSSGFGLRTLSDRSPRFSRLSYHGGTVWPHDTAIAAEGLARAGHPETAASLLRGIAAAAPGFGYRLPELYGGDSRPTAAAPTPYPAACRPQAWSAAAAVSLMATVLGIEPDIPAGRLRVAPGTAPFGALAVAGLRVGGYPLDVSVDVDGAVSLRCDHPGLVLDT
ncbi:MAG: amylo-alpha-1,6-glucosidase [Nocardioidaceae bacterium]